MRSLFPAALACAMALAACGGATERQGEQVSGGGTSSSPPAPLPPPVELPGAAGTPTAGVDLPPGAGGAPAAADVCGCADVEIGWWVQPAAAPPTTEAHITPCNSFSYGPAGAPECRTLLDDCNQAFNMKLLFEALEQSDVQHALEQSPVVYGRDLRGIGGQVDHIEIGGKVIEVGDDCVAGEPCPIPIPEGIAELEHLLGRITLEQRGSCTGQ